MINKAREYTSTKSIIFDATNVSRKKRFEYIEFGKKYGYTNFRCIYVTTSMEISYQRNKTRPEDKQVPRIAYSVYNKYFEEPDGNLEHFTLVIV
jgi:predicted kinase